MPKPACRNRFGNARISGQANVIQGDVHIHVRGAYSALRNELGLPSISEAQALEALAAKEKITRKRLLEDATGCRREVKRRKVIEPPEKDEGATQPLRAKDTSGLELPDQTLRYNGRNENFPRSCVPTWLRHVIWPHGIPLSTVQSPHQHLLPHSSRASTPQHRHGLTLIQQQSQAEHELFMLVTIILSWILGRNIRKDDVVDFLSRCQGDRLLPVMTFLLGVGLYRFFCMKRITANPAPTSPTSIFLEDAFGRQRSLSIDVCVDFSIFRSFLEVHYRGTAGEQLIKAGQFHLMLGTRRGMVVNARNWQCATITAGTHLVNPVYINSEDQRCVECTGDLHVSRTGEFHCTPCGRFYRDCDALKYFTVPGQERTRIVLSRGRRKGGGGAAATTFALSDQPGYDDNSDEVQYQLADLVLVDLRIVPARKLLSKDTKSVQSSTRATRSLLVRAPSSREPRVTSEMLFNILIDYGTIVSLESVLAPLGTDAYSVGFAKVEDAVRAQADLQHSMWTASPDPLTLEFGNIDYNANRSGAASPNLAPFATVLPRQEGTNVARSSVHGEQIITNEKTKTSNDAKLFCLCRQGESGLMLQCDKCLDWYHAECLSLTRDVARDMGSFVCPKCDPRTNTASRLRLSSPSTWREELDSMCFQQRISHVTDRSVPHTVSFQSESTRSSPPTLPSMHKSGPRKLHGDDVTRIKELKGIECPICMDTIENPINFDPCGHALCRDCFSRLIHKAREINAGYVKCPHCHARVDIGQIDQHSMDDGFLNPLRIGYATRAGIDVASQQIPAESSSAAHTTYVNSGREQTVYFSRQPRDSNYNLGTAFAHAVTEPGDTGTPYVITTDDMPDRQNLGLTNSKDHDLAGDTSVDTDIKAIEDDETRCICGQPDYPGPYQGIQVQHEDFALGQGASNMFIQCDSCYAWQHGGCVGLHNESTLPDEYYCERCRPEYHDVAESADLNTKYSRYLPALSDQMTGLPAVLDREQNLDEADLAPANEKPNGNGDRNCNRTSVEYLQDLRPKNVVFKPNDFNISDFGTHHLHESTPSGYVSG